MKTLCKMLVVVVILSLIQGCHTVNGLGQDIAQMTEKYVESAETYRE